MSAEILRRAAASMRERADAATPGPWHSLGQWLAHDVDHCTCYGGSLPQGHEGGCGIEQIGTLPALDAKHIASWHPAVALAVADWLDTAGADLWAHGPLCDCGGGCLNCDDDLWQPHVRRALTVARAYLGDDR